MNLRAVVVGALLPVATAARAQQPTISPSLANVLQRDTTVAVWLMARPDNSLANVENLVQTLGGEVRRRSNWLWAESANLNSTGIIAAQRSTGLRHIQPVAIVAETGPGI